MSGLEKEPCANPKQEVVDKLCIKIGKLQGQVIMLKEEIEGSDNVITPPQLNDSVSLPNNSDETGENKIECSIIFQSPLIVSLASSDLPHPFLI